MPRKQTRNIEKTRNRPLSARSKQMLLGTLLGDGTMDFSVARYGRYSAIHSSKQAAYCRYKAKLLAAYVRTLPRVVENHGWGDKNIVFGTVTTPSFERIRQLCFRLDPATGKYVRCVNRAWLDELTWEGIAFWYQDDGTLCNGSSITLCTHRYSKRETELLARMLTERGCPAKVQKVVKKKPRRAYWVVRLGLESARKFIQEVSPFVRPSMVYKLQIKERRTVPCAFCGKPLVPRGRQAAAEYPCCGAPDCRRAGNRIRNTKLLTEENRKEKNQRARQRYRANLAESRARSRETARKSRQDPVKRAKMRARKRAWRRRLKGTPEHEATLWQERKRYYRRLMADPVRREKKNDRNRRRRRNLTRAQRDYVNAQQRERRRKHKRSQTGE